MKLKYLMEEFLSYGKTSGAKIDLFSVFKNPSKEDYFEARKETMLVFKDVSLAGNYRFIIDIGNKNVYMASACCIHEEILRVLRKNNIELSDNVELGFSSKGGIYPKSLKIPAWAKKYLGQK